MITLSMYCRRAEALQITDTIDGTVIKADYAARLNLLFFNTHRRQRSPLIQF